MDIRAKRSGVFMGSMVDAGEEVKNLTLVPQHTLSRLLPIPKARDT